MHHIAERQTIPKSLVFTRVDGTPIRYMDDDESVVYEEAENDTMIDEGDDPVQKIDEIAMTIKMM